VPIDGLAARFAARSTRDRWAFTTVTVLKLQYMYGAMQFRMWVGMQLSTTAALIDDMIIDI
jgi:hypothetical protein